MGEGRGGRGWREVCMGHVYTYTTESDHIILFQEWSEVLRRVDDNLVDMGVVVAALPRAACKEGVECNPWCNTAVHEEAPVRGLHATARETK